MGKRIERVMDQKEELRAKHHGISILDNLATATVACTHGCVLEIA